MSEAARVDVRRLQQSEIAAYRAVRLDALRLHPHAFGSSFEEESVMSLDEFQQRWPPPPGAVFGGFAGDRLVGIAGLLVQNRLKQRHKGFVFGVYVEQGYRHGGLARRLVQATVDLGREIGLRFVWLTVAVGNDNARRIYIDMGFRPYGLERRALLVGDQFVDEEMMALDLDTSA
jgi:RimJ/RimL family protein N-acetyltransferase